jgi:4-cresol dehydrogenase (hydroxylating)
MDGDPRRGACGVAGGRADRDLDPFAVGPSALRPVFTPSAALPASVDEIQAVLRIATEYRIPLWTVSTGRNFAYGGAAPRN